MFVGFGGPGGCEICVAAGSGEWGPRQRLVVERLLYAGTSSAEIPGGEVLRSHSDLRYVIVIEIEVQIQLHAPNREMKCLF